jgi:hypothetical protein
MSQRLPANPTDLMVPELRTPNAVADLNRRIEALEHGPIADHWHYIGGSGEPAFLNGWANVGTADTLARFKKVNGIVYVQGRVTRAAGASNTSIFTLPAGYRPSNETEFAVRGPAATDLGFIWCRPGGTVAQWAPTWATLWLDGVIFPADQ